MGATETPIIVVDFFCGAGGMTNGLIRAGLHVLAGVDNEPVCEMTYIQNKNRDGSRPTYMCKDVFPRSRKYPAGQRDAIREGLAELIRKFKKTSGSRNPKLIFSICAPCQPFTKITKIEMSVGRQFKRDNDSNLLLTTLHFIRHFKPDAIICENVEGLVNEDSGSVITQFKYRLARAGYSFDAKIINASRFGVPQNRRRTIGLAFQKKRYGKVVVPEADPKVKRIVTVAETIGHLPPLAAGERHSTIRNHRARDLSDLNLKRIASVRPGESNHSLSDTAYGDLSLECHRQLKARSGHQSFSDTYTRMRGDHLAPTITTKCISITNGRFGHYDTRQNRGISLKEAALLQTFPESYIFSPEDRIHLAATLIGNAVPPKLAEYFGRFVAQQIAEK